MTHIHRSGFQISFWVPEMCPASKSILLIKFPLSPSLSLSLSSPFISLHNILLLSNHQSLSEINCFADKIRVCIWKRMESKTEKILNSSLLINTETCKAKVSFVLLLLYFSLSPCKWGWVNSRTLLHMRVFSPWSLFCLICVTCCEFAMTWCLPPLCCVSCGVSDGFLSGVRWKQTTHFVYRENMSDGFSLEWWTGTLTLSVGTVIYGHTLKLKWHLSLSRCFAKKKKKVPYHVFCTIVFQFISWRTL